MTPQHFEIHVSHTGVAVDLIAEATGLSKQKVKDAMTKGACWWSKGKKRVRLRKAKQDVHAGQHVELYYDDRILALEPAAAELIFEGPRYSVWYKPQGLHTQGTQWGDHCSLLRVAEKHRNRPCFLIHRLDADAAGLVLIAHDGKAASVLSERFVSRKVKKIYRALVKGELNADSQEVREPVDGKAALSTLKTLAVLTEEDATLVEVNIETGRKHQIRKHLAHLGHPIIGDRLYGNASAGGLKLAAVKLGFDCPFARQRQVFELSPSRLGELGLMTPGEESV
ncbi:RNA pseudouridine synthase [Marinobacter sp. CHS3-4]|uniref:RluA family pseudouridine synthase n=1 Tax=Marinobacter sp. CHS3-4 TaxID=3045174 RepID=UPI0024B5165B|nr:RNA pseudouridine synthase [Marinobacter sp. CHS3-4]MDI9246017.1 RNA pseudouridine synthase [Marinobacter sp. CHS3-4]